jgi:hypothetical protein
LEINVAPAPASPVGAAVGIQAVVDQAEVAGRIALHNKHELGVDLTERTLGANVLVEPFIGDYTGVGALAVAVIETAADSRPGSGVIVVSVGPAWLDDVEEPRELAPQPRTGVVLVRD